MLRSDCKIKAYFVVPKKSNMAPGTERVRDAYRVVKTLYNKRYTNRCKTNISTQGITLLQIYNFSFVCSFLCSLCFLCGWGNQRE